MDYSIIISKYIDNQSLINFSITNKYIYKRLYEILCYRKTIYTFNYYLTNKIRVDGCRITCLLDVRIWNKIIHPYFHKDYMDILNLNCKCRTLNVIHDCASKKDKFDVGTLEKGYYIFKNLSLDDIKIYLKRQKKDIIEWNKSVKEEKRSYILYKKDKLVITNIVLLNAFFCFKQKEDIKFICNNLKFSENFIYEKQYLLDNVDNFIQ